MKKIFLMVLLVLFSGNTFSTDLLHTSINWDRISWMEIFWNKHAILPACMVSAFIINNLWWKRTTRKYQQEAVTLKGQNKNLKDQIDNQEELKKEIIKLKKVKNDKDETIDNIKNELKKKRVILTDKEIINQAEIDLAKLKSEHEELRLDKESWKNIAESDTRTEYLRTIKKHVLQMQTRSELTSADEQVQIDETMDKLGFVKEWTITGNWYKNDPKKNFPQDTHNYKDQKNKLAAFKSLPNEIDQIGIIPKKDANREIIKKLCNELGFTFESENKEGIVFSGNKH